MITLAMTWYYLGIVLPFGALLYRDDRFSGAAHALAGVITPAAFVFTAPGPILFFVGLALHIVGALRYMRYLYLRGVA